ncbi:MAG: thiamine pyrophosphate-dependent enzyme [Candidatus Cloacimonetes bacterium]|nr:thiamine pyrophosphate-dependent enzyme [Candidatus Cloacimonadota bacterium]MDD4156772.1 thiamine pyrophosphate-dependent enzyme [Candidatus Cloacimonadota bacterium]
MEKLLLLGDEAFAQGAIDAGISGAYGYPGTPSTEIIEYIQKNSTAISKNLHRVWSANEKTAMESALGMSYAGKRAIVTMKHVGLNVAADGFVNSSITGTNGGLLVTVADDPSMHSSQNEQDSRFYAKFSLIPALEPSNQQEAYDMASYGLELSEKFELPVLVRFVTRLSHSRSGVITKQMKAENQLKLPKDRMKFILLPAVARKSYKNLLAKQEDLIKASEESPFNTYIDGKDKSLGIIACGLAYNYLMENFTNNECTYPVLKISQYPLPKKYIQKMYKECDSIIVLEDGAPIVEEMLKGYLANGKTIKGRLDGSLPRDGELNPNLVAEALNLDNIEGNNVPEIIASRPPALCVGCPHIDTYNALNEAIKPYGDGHVFADIGCYTLGALPPYQAINSCVDMGASITMAKGAADAGLFPSIAVIGDSTFTHSGITGLLDCVNENTNVVVVIVDNETTAMTGGQDSAGHGKIEKICVGLGVDPEHIRVCLPLKRNHEELVKIFNEEINFKGVSVIIPRRECIQTLKKKNKK